MSESVADLIGEEDSEDVRVLVKHLSAHSIADYDYEAGSR
jgi:hypothetical protein